MIQPMLTVQVGLHFISLLVCSECWVAPAFSVWDLHTIIRELLKEVTTTLCTCVILSFCTFLCTLGAFKFCPCIILSYKSNWNRVEGKLVLRASFSLSSSSSSLSSPFLRFPTGERVCDVRVTFESWFEWLPVRQALGASGPWCHTVWGLHEASYWNTETCHPTTAGYPLSDLK